MPAGRKRPSESRSRGTSTTSPRRIQARASWWMATDSVSTTPSESGCGAKGPHRSARERLRRQGGRLPQCRCRLGCGKPRRNFFAVAPLGVLPRALVFSHAHILPLVDPFLGRQSSMVSEHGQYWPASRDEQGKNFLAAPIRPCKCALASWTLQQFLRQLQTCLTHPRRRLCSSTIRMHRARQLGLRFLAW